METKKRTLEKVNKAFFSSILCLLMMMSSYSLAHENSMYKSLSSEKAIQAKVVKAVQINPTTFELIFSDGNRFTIDFYGNDVFRLFQDNSGGIVRDPKATPEAKILVDSPRRMVNGIELSETEKEVSISTHMLRLAINKDKSTFTVYNLKDKSRAIFQSIKPIEFDKSGVKITLKSAYNEYYYGGGVQNGRFSHKGKIIAIENQNSWTDGGVASPTPFYWSTAGYGMMWHTFKPGKYDFGATNADEVQLSHKENYLDVFFFIGNSPVELLNGFYQLTGHPVLMPKFGFYQGHLNAYNRDYWKEDEKGILFEDGKRYKESQKDNGGIKESLNGEKGNYMFSARAVVDRYKKYDMPLGWILPNDGYGAGYGQTETLDGNIQNLKSFGDYARKHGVEIGLWTQSDLHPKDRILALLQRDIVKEMRDAGVRVLKTDVAWVGAGYSFGLNGVADVANLTPYYANNARPFIISLDGWAGTQRYAGIWTGDQTGGEWEYIRFHIPTYIGSGLSGQPNISSDMDGIFGGRHLAVNVRDFQWKTFTPMQLNMDGWGSNEKYPHALGEPATSINRMYLKMKSELLPYAYKYSYDAIKGMPLIRAMFLSYPSDYTYSAATKYQFMYGDDFLVAPIYQDTKSDKQGNDIRNNIYLPNGVWIDYITGEKFEGGRIINNIKAPIWKLPVYVRAGAIIPRVNANNNPSEIDKNLRIYEFYPYGRSEFIDYDDDGLTESYKHGQCVTTKVLSELKKNKQVVIEILPARSFYPEFEKNKATHFIINTTSKPRIAKLTVNNSKIKLKEAKDYNEFLASEDVYYYGITNLNQYATEGSEFEKVVIEKNPQLHVKVAKYDVTQSSMKLVIDNYEYNPKDELLVSTGSLSVPTDFSVSEDHITAYTLKPTWKKPANADYCEIEFGGMLYSTITEEEFLFEELQPNTHYGLKIRSVNKDGASDWTTLSVTTKTDPLEFAVRGVTATTTAQAQGGSGVMRMFDFAEKGDIWHTKYNKNALPFTIDIDLNSVNVLDRFQYLPRHDGGNGTILKGKVYHSINNNDWTYAGEIDWRRDGEVKEFSFTGNPSARYIRLDISNAVGGYGSGRELYVFRLKNTEYYIQGDINNDKKIDQNDLTSYMNYMGLRRGDSDFEGYISKGDINGNDMIDVYDVSLVATRLNTEKTKWAKEEPKGVLSLTPSKQTLSEGEEFYITISAKDMKAVNGVGFSLPYNTDEYQFLGIEPIAVGKMENLTYNRLHSNKQTVLYPTFVNLGEAKALEGSTELFRLKFKSLKNAKFNLKAKDGLIVSKSLHTQSF